jgi:hypothetical protein
MERLLNRPQYENTPSVWGKWTNVTTQQTFTPSWEGSGNGQKAIFPPLGLHRSQRYHCHFLQFKIIAPNIHDIGVRRGNAALYSDHKRMKISPIRQPTKRTWHKTQRNKNEIPSVHNAKDSVLAHIWGIPHKTAFLEAK